MTDNDDSVPSELRAHIVAEQLKPDASVFSRSRLSTIRYALTPYFFIAIVVYLASTQTLSVPLLLLASFPLLLAAQRCLQTLVHDLSHKFLSPNLKRNDLLGNYLIAGLTGTSVPAYRAVHLQHHKYNGSTQDPEHISFDLIKQKGGLGKHCLRYVLGLEALRLIKKYYGKKNDSSQNQNQSPALKASKFHVLICQIVLAAIFILVANTWYLYLLWLYLAVSWNPMLSNLRFLVEHPGETDLTVSTSASFLERLYFAPFNFNFHLEHHLWPNLPPYRLPAAHAYLQKQGYFERHPEFQGSGFISSLKRRS